MSLSSRTGQPIRGRVPSYPHVEHIFHLNPKRPGMTIHELFVQGQDLGDEVQLAGLLQKARLRIIDAFQSAPQMVERGLYSLLPESMSPTGNYIPNLDRSLEALVSYVDKIGRAKLVGRMDLPEWYRRLTPEWQDRVCGRAQWLLVAQEVATLASEGIVWYHDYPLGWHAKPSFTDERTALLREVRGWSLTPRELKRDDRGWHGRPRRDRNNGTTPGVSVGMST